MNKTYDINEIKMQLQMAVMTMNGLLMFFPPDSVKTIKNLVTLLTAMLSQEWFAEFLTYMLNTFQDGEITADKLEQALADFAKSCNKPSFLIATSTI
jgi:hypothetical protein